MDVSRYQISAAMALLGLMQIDISAATGISQVTISNMLRGGDAWKAKQSTINKVVAYIESQGVEFLPNDGVRRKPKSTILQLEGQDGFIEFMKMVLKAAESSSVDICVSGVDERHWDQWLGDFADTYLGKMGELYEENRFNFRILIEEGDDYKLASKYAHYRRIPSGNFSSSPIYVFGPNVALIEFESQNVTIWIIQNEKLATAQRKQFNLIWDSLKK